MTLFGPLGPSLAPWLRSFKGFRGTLKSHADWYANLAGYRKLGLKYDDLCACISSLIFMTQELTIS